MAPAGENIYDILRHLAAAAPEPRAGKSFLSELADLPQMFKIILTAPAARLDSHQPLEHLLHRLPEYRHAPDLCTTRT